MDMTERIRAKLTTALMPLHLVIEDESHRHAGHAGRMQQPGHAPAGGGTHFKVVLVADAFTGLGRVARHRMVNGLLAGEFADGVHALQLRLLAPGEEG